VSCSVTRPRHTEIESGVAGDENEVGESEAVDGTTRADAGGDIRELRRVRSRRGRVRSGHLVGQPAHHTTVTCIGSVINQNGSAGFGVVEDQGNTINVKSGASVTGTDTGIQLTGFGDPSLAETVNNSGTISGTDGIGGDGGIVNNNSGATISGGGGNGLDIQSQGIVTNSGMISGTVLGVLVQNGTVTNTSGGTISGGQVGVEIFDDGPMGGAGPAVSNAGTVTGGINGVRFISTDHLGELTNSGLIAATGASGVGALFGGSATVVNSGTIQAAGTGGIAIQAGDTVTVSNSSTGIISGASTGITADTVNVNSAGIISGGTFGIAANTGNILNSGGISAASGDAIVLFDTGIVNNSGTISATGLGSVAIVGGNINAINSGVISSAGGIAIEALGGSTTVTNTSTGTISGVVAIAAGGGAATVANAGRIQATGASGFAILANGPANVTNSGIISGNTAIQADGAATITNSGAIISTAGAGGTAIKLSSAADTLTLTTGSRIVGLVDMGGGATQ
jgi:hypothetical protein